MQETAKSLASKNKNELRAARTLEVSLDRADNVIEGGQAVHTTGTYAFDFTGAVDKNEGVVKRHLFAAMLGSTAWISERWRTEALKLER